MAGTLHEDQYTFLITSRSIVLIKKTASDKSCRKNQNTLLCLITFLENRAVYEIIWKPILEPDRHKDYTYGSYALHTGYLMLQLHAKLIQYLLFFLCNNGSTNAPYCYVVRTLPVLFHSPSHDHCNSTPYGLQVMKLPIVRFYTFVCHILTLRLKCPHPTLPNPQPVFFL
jgi:hypothetical protein